MADPRTPLDDAYVHARLRRRRARRVMQTLTVLCALTAGGIGAEQFISNGLPAFLNRPPGIGATPATPAPTPAVTQRR